MEGQETRDLGAMAVHQGYKLSFIILYGHSRLDRPNEITHPPTLNNVRKMVGYVDLKDIFQNGFNMFQEFVSFMIFDWL